MRGFIRKRGKAWEVIVEAGKDPLTGRRRQVSRSVKGGKRDAERLLADLLAKSTTGEFHGTTATVNSLLDEWLRVSAPRWSPKNLIETRRMAARYLRPAIGDMPLRKLATIDIDRLYAAMLTTGGVKGTGVSPATVRRVHVVLRSALAQAVRWRWLTVNPAVNAQVPTVPRKVLNPPTPAQVLTLLAAAEDEDVTLAVFLRLAATTGARRGELLGLTWGDVGEGFVTIRQAVGDGEGTTVIKPTKTSAERRVPIGADTAAVLERYRLVRAEEFLSLGAPLAPEHFVFARTYEPWTPLRPETMTHRFIELRNRVGVNARLHDLRHYVGTHLVAGGTDLRTVMDRLGHASLATATGYLHAVEAGQKAAGEAMDDLLRSRG